MKRHIILGMAISAFSASVAMAEVAPENVTYTDGAVAESLTGVPGDPVAGKEAMGSKSIGNCVACHASEMMKDVPFPGTVGPALDGAGDRWSEAELRGIVSDAKKTFEDSVMPSFYKTSGYIRPGDAYTGKAGTEPLPPLLTAQQIEDVVAYLMTFKE
jgi:sulfur-oxidizing protein SoxX